MNLFGIARARTKETPNASEGFQMTLDHLLADNDRIDVLDIGCGAKCNLSFKQDVFMVGVDPSESQLAKNIRLDERIHGTAETVDFAESKFDVIIFFDVLEHVDQPTMILKKCCGWLKKRGLLVIASPRVLTPEGLITKFTPYRFHQLVYRSLLKTDGASMQGSDPFPTYLRLSILPSRIRRFSERNGMKVEYSKIYNRRKVEELRKTAPVLANTYSLILMILDAMTFGRWKPHLSSYHLILRRT